MSRPSRARRYRPRRDHRDHAGDELLRHVLQISRFALARRLGHQRRSKRCDQQIFIPSSSLDGRQQKGARARVDRIKSQGGWREKRLWPRPRRLLKCIAALKAGRTTSTSFRLCALDRRHLNRAPQFGSDRKLHPMRPHFRAYVVSVPPRWMFQNKLTGWKNSREEKWRSP
jgi:hypothetical protein